MDYVPPEFALGPAAPGVVAGVPVAAGELAAIGPAEWDVMLRAFRKEAMVIALAVPEAGLQALGALGTEEGSGGLGDPHGRSLPGRGCRRPAPAVSRGLRLLQGASEGGTGSLHGDRVSGAGCRGLLESPAEGGSLAPDLDGPFPGKRRLVLGITLSQRHRRRQH